MKSKLTPTYFKKTILVKLLKSGNIVAGKGQVSSTERERDVL